jgi:hypothetical protein
MQQKHQQNKTTIARINESKTWLFKKINEIDKLQIKLTKRKREKAHNNTIRDEKGDTI